jgi:hypothetical protein
MASDRFRLDRIQVKQVGSKVQIDVPWDEAEQWAAYLKGLAFGSTLQLDPLERTASLELWTNLTADWVQNLLAGRQLATQP